jgi:dolichol-phosphate mannosyltransferase
MLKVLTIAPTYNEIENIEAFVSGFFSHNTNDLLIVDDNSPDGTGAKVRELAQKDERIYLMNRESKDGLGRAYQAGFQWAFEKQYDVVVAIDVDGSHDVAVIPLLVKSVNEKTKLVIGSRYVDGGSTQGWSLLRISISRFGNLYSRLLLKRTTLDLTSGFRAYSLQHLMENGAMLLQPRGYGFQIAVANLFRDDEIKEIPINFIDRVAGSSKMNYKIALEAFLEVIKMRVFSSKN